MKILIIIFCLVNFFPSAGNASYSVRDTLNIKYGEGYYFKDNKKEKKDLLLDIYSPVSTCYLKKPFVMFIHGGGFHSGSKNGMRPLAKELAQKGFVTSSMNYRLIQDNPVPFDNARKLVADGLDKTRAFQLNIMGINVVINLKTINWVVKRYKEDTAAAQHITFKKRQVVAMAAAIEDASKALNFIYANADQYCIDKNRISVLGFSAGSITALNLVYAAKNYNISIPKIKSVVNIYGAYMHVDLLKSSSPKLLSLHGTKDKTISYKASEILHNKERSKGMKSKLILVDAGHGGNGFLNIVYEKYTLKKHIYEFLK